MQADRSIDARLERKQKVTINCRKIDNLSNTRSNPRENHPQKNQHSCKFNRHLYNGIHIKSEANLIELFSKTNQPIVSLEHQKPKWPNVHGRIRANNRIMSTVNAECLNHDCKWKMKEFRLDHVLLRNSESAKPAAKTVHETLLRLQVIHCGLCDLSLKDIK